MEVNYYYFFFFNLGSQGAGDKAEPGRMNFSSVSREASHQHRGVPSLFSISVRAEEEAILVVSGGLTFQHSLPVYCFSLFKF